MQKIALCITELEPGGAERCLVRLATNLDRTRFMPKVYVLAPPPADQILLDTLEAAEVPVHFFGVKHLWQFPLAIRRLRHQLSEDRPDVVQSFLFHANIVARLAAKKLDHAKIYSGIRVAERRHHWPLWLDRMTERYVTAHVAVSESVARFSIDEAGLSTEKMVVIPNCVDTELFSNIKNVELHSTAKLIYVGRLDPQKNVQMLLRAMPGLLETLAEKGIDAELTMVGEGPERATLEQLRTKLGLENRVHLLGQRNDVPQLLESATLLVLPSRWEGMPNVVLEAMAAGRPIVASRVEGVAELLGDTLDAQSFPSGDPDAMCARIVSILTDPSLATSLSQANHARAANEFSIPRMIERYEALWK